MEKHKDVSSLTSSYSGLLKIMIAAVFIAILFAAVFAGYIFSMLRHVESEIKTNIEYQK